MSVKQSAVTHFGTYAAYINLAVDDEAGVVRVLVRSRAKPDGTVGDTGMIVLSRSEWSQLLADQAGG